MILGVASLLADIEKAIGSGDGKHAIVPIHLLEDMQALLRPAAKQDAGQGIVVLFRLPSGRMVEPDGSERESSRLFIPTTEQQHSCPVLAAAFDAKLSEQDTITHLYDAYRSLLAAHLRTVERSAYSSVVVPLSQFERRG